MSKNKRTYTEEFKIGAINLALKSSSVKAAADNMGIPSGTLNTWLKEYSKGKSSNIGQSIDLSIELKNLRKENSRLREEREILKKAATFFAKEVK